MGQDVLEEAVKEMEKFVKKYNEQVELGKMLLRHELKILLERLVRKCKEEEEKKKEKVFPRIATA